ncbi:IS66-like element accessory protein TnpA [Roseateles cavernae]|uniref:IS66-like element accessory protein TnpA n=1 Tax=Roseateles cavernae TaxID=3153578 RepID=UPI0032E41FF4
MASDKPARRRTYDETLKAQVLAECEAPGTSVAKVALAHGINANVVHRWRQLVREGKPSVPAISSGFVPVSLAAAPATQPVAIADIQVELRRGAIAMTINWPTSAAAEFAAWTRELLR